MKKYNILVTGGAGYVGSVLIPALIYDNHHVKCLDRFFFGDEYLSSKSFEGKIELIKDDIRFFDPKILEGIDLVIDLAALSNDPVGELDPEKTYEINYKGRVRVAKLSKEAGVPQYILASSASIFGQQHKIVDESSEVFPITAYSKANRKAEIDNLALNDDKFSVTVLRFSSLYGLSPRMRFDIAVNEMVLEFFKKGKITVRGKDNQRPFLHIKDAIQAYKLVVQSKVEKITGQIFNVGSDEQNYKIGDLALEIKKALGNNCDIEFGDNKDHRSYAVSFKKIRETLGFKPKFSVADGAIEIFNSLKKGDITDSIKTITLKWYKHILSDHSLLKELSINDKLL